MIRKTILLALVIGAVQFAGAASADPVSRSRSEAFSERFAYDPAAPVEKTYANFERKADRICSLNRGSSGKALASQHRLQSNCVASMVDEAVKATGSEALLAFHAHRTGADVQIATVGQH